MPTSSAHCRRNGKRRTERRASGFSFRASADRNIRSELGLLSVAVLTKSSKPLLVAGSALFSAVMVLRRSPMAEARSPLLPQLLQLLAQAAVTPDQASQIKRVDQPRDDISGIEKLESFHREPRPEPVPASDSWAWACSTSRRKISRRKRDQQTRNAKKRNAVQLTMRTWSMRGSMEPPPPITGCGCCVRKNQMEK